MTATVQNEQYCWRKVDLGTGVDGGHFIGADVWPYIGAGVREGAIVPNGKQRGGKGALTWFGGLVWWVAWRVMGGGTTKSGGAEM